MTGVRISTGVKDQDYREPGAGLAAVYAPADLQNAVVIKQ